MDIKMIEHVAHKYEDVAHEYEVPVSMIKMKECEAYAPLPYKPWHPQAMQNGVVLVELIWFSLDPFVDFFLLT